MTMKGMNVLCVQYEMERRRKKRSVRDGTCAVQRSACVREELSVGVKRVSVL